MEPCHDHEIDHCIRCNFSLPAQCLGWSGRKAWSHGSLTASAQLELEQAKINAEMREIELAASKLNLDYAKARLEFLHLPAKGKKQTPKSAVPVRLEYVEKADEVIVRGPKASVEKIRSLIQRSVGQKE